MQVISPVLNGTNLPAYNPALTNFNTGAAAPAATSVDDTSSTDDSRRYSKFDRSASEVADSGMSFGDFLDIINPLQHIPIVSSVYREITGDKISPVARVAGNILYGAVFGVAGAVVGGVGAIADSMLEGETGKDMTGTVVATLFGDDNKPAAPDNAAATQLASNPTTIATQQAVNARPNGLQAVTQQTMTSDALAKAKAAAEKAGTAVPATDQAQGMALARAIPLNRSAYGGVMAPLPPTRTFHDENLAMSMAQATGGIHVGNVIYANRLKDGARAVPAPVPAAPQTATAQTTATTPAPAAATGPTISALPASGSDAMAQAAASQMTASGAMPATPIPAANSNSMPSGLADDALIMKALGLYRNVADGTQGSTN